MISNTDSTLFIYSTEHMRVKAYTTAAGNQSGARQYCPGIFGGIQKRFGWHTFWHTYSTLLRSVGTEFKVMQELLRHSSLRSTLDVYTQAISPAKHAAQAAVLALVSPLKPTPSQSRKRGQIVKAAQLKTVLIASVPPPIPAATCHVAELVPSSTRRKPEPKSVHESWT